MRSSHFPLRIPNPLFDCLPHRVEELGYDNRSQYVIGLIRRDLALCGGSHAEVLEISFRSRDFQDRMDDSIGNHYLQHIGLPPQFQIHTRALRAYERERPCAELVRIRERHNLCESLGIKSA